MTTISVPRVSGGLSCIEQNDKTSECLTASRPYLRAKYDAKKTVLFTRPDCGMWNCEHCGERNKRMWMGRNIHACEVLAEQGHTMYFVTITSHAKVRDVKYGLKVWRDAKDRLFRRARYVADIFEYCWVPEHVDRRHFHVHLITTASMDAKWWKDNAAAVGMGWKNESKQCHDLRKAGLYTAKYLNKNLGTEGWPKFMRRVNTSRKWPKLPDKSTDDPLEWQICGSWDKAAMEMVAFRENGWKVKVV